jgi:hypothetical protein
VLWAATIGLCGVFERRLRPCIAQASRSFCPKGLMSLRIGKGPLQTRRAGFRAIPLSALSGVSGMNFGAAIEGLLRGERRSQSRNGEGAIARLFVAIASVNTQLRSRRSR